MVHVQQQHVPLRFQGDQSCTQKRCFAQIERAHARFHQRLYFFLCAPRHFKWHFHTLGDTLHKLIFPHRKRGAE
ncbi:hypothetical protein D3C75_897500 [compost metagenome]